MASLQLQLPAGLSMEVNIAINWKDWKRTWEIYATAIELDEKNDKLKIATLLHVAGPQAQALFETLPLSAAEKKG